MISLEWGALVDHFITSLWKFSIRGGWRPVGEHVFPRVGDFDVFIMFWSYLKVGLWPLALVECSNKLLGFFLVKLWKGTWLPSYKLREVTFFLYHHTFIHFSSSSEVDTSSLVLFFWMQGISNEANCLGRETFAWSDSCLGLVKWFLWKLCKFIAIIFYFAFYISEIRVSICVNLDLLWYAEFVLQESIKGNFFMHPLALTVIYIIYRSF